MRIDVFLRLAGLLKTRTTAARACDGGFVSVNDRTARPSTLVAQGDSVSLVLPDGRALVVRVESIPEGRSVPRGERRGLYTEITGESSGE